MMTASAMANSIISQIQNIDKPEAANSSFMTALCNYVSSAAEVYYGWSAVSPPPASTPDPTVIIQAKIVATGSLSPSGANTPESALAAFSASLNATAATWTILWPPGFALSPALVIPTINITPSMKDNMNDAWNAVCGQIIAGIKAATPAATGSHGAYVGAASFTQIL